jgi:hypothetical protein
MSDLSIEVQQLLAQGLSHEEISIQLGIPVGWVEAEAEYVPESDYYYGDDELDAGIGLADISGESEY